MTTPKSESLNADKSKVGLYEKFQVRRSDGTDLPGCKHYGCRYFVLDMTHDEFAKPAIVAYATACKEKFPELAKDLMKWASEDDANIELAEFWNDGEAA